LDAQVTNQDGQVIWSDTYSGPHVSIVVPGAIFSSEQFCELTITETVPGMMAVGAFANGPTVTSKDLTKEFRQSDWPNGAKMLIILPDKDVFEARKPAIIECAEACEARSVTWLALYHKNVTTANLTYLYNKPGVKYIYWFGHANNRVGGSGNEVPRTYTMCWKHTVRNWWPDKWERIPAFSYTNNPQAPLPGDWDSKGFSLWSLGMYDSGNKKIIFVDGCRSADSIETTAPYQDMGDAYGILSNYGANNQIYIGWRYEIYAGTGIGGTITGQTTEAVRLFWEKMGYGDDVWGALYYMWISGGVGMQQAVWGDNGQMDMGVLSEDDNIFCWGNGLTRKLEP